MFFVHVLTVKAFLMAKKGPKYQVSDHNVMAVWCILREADKSMAVGKTLNNVKTETRDTFVFFVSGARAVTSVPGVNMWTWAGRYKRNDKS